jgi:hypothetical protein
MNPATKIIVSTIGVLLSLAGLDHGFFEILQGSQPTKGLVIQAIGPAQKMWHYGTEEAFSIVPNFLVTGILAILVSLAILVWSVRFIFGGGWGMFLLTFVAGFADDIQSGKVYDARTTLRGENKDASVKERTFQVE